MTQSGKLKSFDKRLIERDTGVLFRQRQGNERLAPYECHSLGTVKMICQAKGHDHITLVLRSIVNTPHNADQLYRATIIAVSEFFFDIGDKGDDVVIAQAVIDGIRLEQLRVNAKQTHLDHISVRMADRLITMTQDPVW